MRIVNSMPHPRHISYASSSFGGRTLNAGEIGPELNLSHVFLPILQKDLRASKIQIRLSDKDKQFITFIQAEGDKPLRVVKQITKPKPKPKIKPKSISKSMLLQPQVQPKAKAKIKEIKDINPEELKRGNISLSDLQAANENAPGKPVFSGDSTTIDAIAKHIGGTINASKNE